MFIKEDGLKKWNQEVYFENGTKRSTKNVVKIEQGNWFHLQTEDGEEQIFNPDKILFIKVWKDEKTKTRDT